MAEPPSDDDVELALKLLDLWDNGRGISKSELERRTWEDGSSHGRRFDRFMRRTLQIETTGRARQTDLIEDLQTQVRSLGAQPVGTPAAEWETQLQQARASCLQALRVWNDPLSSFRTGAFSLLFVTAWNSLSLAVLQRGGEEWRKLDFDGQPTLFDGVEQSLDTLDLISRAFGGTPHRGMRENVARWVELRNATAHRHLPGLDVTVIPFAQAGLLNFENALTSEFGAEYSLAESLSVPLQLSGFRDPGVLASARKLHASLPLDVQTLLGRAEAVPDEVLNDPTYMIRVAFVPVPRSSANNPDAVAYFVRPGEVPAELADALDQFVVLSRPVARHGFRPSEVVSEVCRRTGMKFTTAMHAEACRKLGVRPPKGQHDRTMNLNYAEYLTSYKSYLYTQAWIDRLVAEFAEPQGFAALTGVSPVHISVPHPPETHDG